MKRKSNNLSQHPTKGYRLQIGHYVTSEGKRSDKVWWFGRVDIHQAEFQVSVIRHIFRERCPDGMWTADATEFAKQVIARNRISYDRSLQSAVRFLESAGMIVRPAPTPSLQPGGPRL